MKIRILAGRLGVVVSAFFAFGCVGPVEPRPVQNPPAARTGAPQAARAAGPLSVELDGSGVRVEGKAVAGADLHALLKRHARRPIVIRPSPELPLGALSEVLEGVRRSGHGSVSVSVRERTEELALETSNWVGLWLFVRLRGGRAEFKVWSSDPETASRVERLELRLSDQDAAARLRTWLPATCPHGACRVLVLDVDREDAIADWAGAAAFIRSSWPSDAPAPETNLDILATPGPLEARQLAESGRLPPRLIQSVFRRSYSMFVDCYVAGLTRNPHLAGKVSVRFVISESGAVHSVSTEGAELPDAEVVQCIQKAAERIRFPKPSGGTVTVVYPLTFAPRDP